MTFHRMQLGRVSAPLPPGAPTLDGHAIMDATPPPRLIRSYLPFEPTLGGNDLCGDCTAVAVGNTLRAQMLLNGGADVGLTDAQCVKLYSAVSGYYPALPATDVGATEVDMLTHQAQEGFAAGNFVYSGLWANIPIDRIDLIKLVTARVGCVYLGLNLLAADQTADTWDTGGGDQSPWGAHAAVLWDYEGPDDTDVIHIATWGVLQRATWRWLRSRLEEAHVLYFLQALGPAGRSWAGLDHDRLAADVASFGAVA